MTTSVYYENLKKNVIEHSQADDWHSAVNEWEIDDVEEDETLTESCVCGKENLRYLFTIRNEFNGKKLYPIGSSSRDAEIMAMSADDVFKHVCNWEGLIDYSNTIKYWVENIYGVTLK